ncbi:hypothetical protein SCHPADRAFT_580495 [Schizopora paradoxa]|uniref:Uncharacterized protein n=1 Tax=Schizopora paradoxa TaxID=27342 RepID=A0A0H2RB50_9AGAM|nr:hypothetical protein SCHPADRAFT_580495 [Schizopora paradoxa]
MQYIGNDLSKLPLELLDRVFDHCERRHLESEQESDVPTFFPNHHLHSLLFVCKRWHAVAERRLYTSVSLGSDRTVTSRDGRPKKIKGKDICERFLETVQENTHLAFLVRELRVASDNALRREETSMHIRLFGLCKNAEKIVLYGCHSDLFDELAAGLAKTDLVSLQLYRYNLGMYDGSMWATPPMFSPKTVLGLLQRWPRLRNFHVDLAHTGYDETYHPLYPLVCTDSLPKLPLVPGSCTALKELIVSGVSSYPGQLEQLMELAPGLEELEMAVRGDCGGVLQRCMQAWSHSLRRLSVAVNYPSELSSADEYPVIRCTMPKLRHMCMPAPLLSANAVVFIPNLETLEFRGDFSQGKELARLIELSAAPHLRKINVQFYSADWHAEPHDDVVVHTTFPERMDAKIALAKELRRVCGKRGIVVEDWFSRSKEFEELLDDDF